MLQKLKGLGQRLLALTLSLAFALVLMEVVLRVAFPAQTKFYVWPPHTHKALKPDPAKMPGVAPQASFTVNAQGMRGRDFGPDGEHRILAVGGSTTECLYIDDAEAWPALVNKALPRTAKGDPVWVGNVGKAGMYSRDHVLHVKYLTAQYPHIDTVTLLVGINDVTTTLAQGDHWATPAPITDPEAERKQIRRAFALAPGRLQDVTTDELGHEDAAIYKRTALYQLVKRTRAGLASRAGARGLAQDEFGSMYARWRDHRKHASAVVDKAPDLSGALAEYRRNLEAIAAIAAERSIRLVLITQPTLWRNDLPKETLDLLWMGGQGNFQEETGKPYYTVAVLIEVMAKFNEVVLDVCKAKGLSCLDLAAKIPKETAMFYDDCHFTVAGSRAVSAAVAKHLEQLPPFTL